MFIRTEKVKGGGKGGKKSERAALYCEKYNEEAVNSKSEKSLLLSKVHKQGTSLTPKLSGMDDKISGVVIVGNDERVPAALRCLCDCCRVRRSTQFQREGNGCAENRRPSIPPTTLDRRCFSVTESLRTAASDRDWTS